MSNVDLEMTRHALRVAEREAAEWHRVMTRERDENPASRCITIMAERAESWSRLALSFRANILGVASLCI